MTTDAGTRLASGPSTSGPGAGRRARLREHLTTLLPDGERLIVVSNRGPLSFVQRDDGGWAASRGSGGLVTALGELGSLAPVSWISAAMDAGDRAAAAALGGTGGDPRPVEALIREQLPRQDIRLRLTDVPDDAYALHYGTVSNPFLWFVQHQLYRLPYEPQVDDELIDAWRNGYRVVNELLAAAALRESGTGRPVVMVQD